MSPAEDDVDRIMAVMQAGFDPAYGEAWTRRQVEDALVIGNCHYQLADEKGQLALSGSPAVGFFLSRGGFEEEELLLIAVDPAYRRRGIGGRLLNALASAAKSRGAKRLLLEMRRGNTAGNLYRDFGFQPIGERRHYYRMANGERIDAITFACDLEQVA